MNSALITGGGGRTGQAIASRLLADGWRVALIDVNEQELRAAKSRLGEPDRVDAQVLDVTRLDDVRAWVQDCVKKCGPFAGLVNAAGGRVGASVGPFIDSDPQSWRSVIDLHLRSVIGCCYAVLPSMFEARAGSIVTIVAFEGLRGAAGAAVFSAAKAGAIVLTETLVAECQRFGVRVNAIAPPPPLSLTRNSVSDASIQIAEAATFLLSDRSSLTTGACLDVSAGWALY